MKINREEDIHERTVVMNLTKLSLEEFISTVASSSPAPGGGSVSALAGALGASLAIMVCNLTIGKPKFAANEGVLRDVKFKLEENMESLINIIQQDADAFEQVMKAYKLPKSNEEEKMLRIQEIDKANLHAAEVPLNAAKQCLNILQSLSTVVSLGNPNAITDVGTAAHVTWAGLNGALYNVRINLQGLKDKNVISELEDVIKKLYAEGKEHFDKVLLLIEKGLQ